MQTTEPLLHIIWRNKLYEPIREDKIIKSDGQYEIWSKLQHEPNFKKLSSFKMLIQALDDPNINVKRTNISIKTSMKLMNIRDYVLNKWVDWDKDQDQLVIVNDKHYHKILNPLNSPPKDFKGKSGDNNLNDPICRMLKSIFVCEKNTKQYTTTKREIIRLLKSKGYISYTGDSRDFGGLTASGMSVIYKVPHDKQGHLKPYRYKTIRVCCLGSQHRAMREFMAGPIDEIATPADKTLTPEIPNFPSFPGFLNEIEIYDEIPIKLQIHIANRSIDKLKNYLNERPLSPDTIDRLQASAIISSLGQEGNLDILKVLRSAGVCLGGPISNQESAPTPIKAKYWHSTLLEIYENHPKKTKEFITLYTQDEFKDLITKNTVHPIVKNIQDILLTEKERRLKKKLGEISNQTIDI